MGNEANIALFRDLVSLGDELYTWRYNEQLQLLDSKCKDGNLLDIIFRHSGFQTGLLEYFRSGHAPLVLSNQLGMVWIICLEKSTDKSHQIHLVGPAFSASVSTEKLSVILGETYPADASLAFKWEIARMLEKLPVVSPMILTRYALMLHYCVNNEKLVPSDISTLRGSGYSARPEETSPRSQREAWLIEEDLLHKVRSGDLQYRSALNRANVARGSVMTSYKDPLRQSKNAAIIFVSLSTRAAIEGGLSPEQAYALDNAYLQSIEECRSQTDVEVLDNAMYEDFIRRVHKVRQQPGLSRQIRSCCDYIDLHAEEKLTLSLFSQMTGYTEYYLSRKFKTEVGQSINDYIRHAKIEKAKMLLVTTDDSIQAIADQLNFSSRSFFADSFRALTGVPPAEYRLNSF